MEPIKKQHIDLKNKTILVTGAAGFIGANLVKRILMHEPTATVVGLDSVNDYYDVRIKEYRITELSAYPAFTFIKGNLRIRHLFQGFLVSISQALWLILLHRRG